MTQGYSPGRRNDTMRRYTNLHPLWMSFYAREIYQDAARNWRGMGLLYLLLLLALCWIPEMVVIHERIGAWIDRETPKIIAQIPEIRIENGRVWVDADDPVLIKYPDTDTVAVIIDVTGQYTSLEHSEAFLLLTETRLFIRDTGTGEVRQFDIPENENIVITRQTLTQLMEAMKSSLSIVLYPVFVLIAFVYRAIQALLYGGIGLIFVHHFNAVLPYTTVVRLAAIAVTPAVILDTAYRVLDASIPFWTGICFLVAMCYLYFGVKVTLFQGSEEER